MNEFTRGYFALNITKHALNVTGINLCELRNNGLRNPEITVANFSILLPKPIHHSHHPKLGLMPGYEKISDKKIHLNAATQSLGAQRLHSFRLEQIFVIIIVLLLFKKQTL